MCDDTVGKQYTLYRSLASSGTCMLLKVCYLLVTADGPHLPTWVILALL